MKVWIGAIRTSLTVNYYLGHDHAIGGDPRGGGHPFIWALLAAILGGVASGAAEQAAGAMLGR
ncbi:hypothetical protein [Streptomyces triculaminicus]|uniref:hypothetical protein n=1 Tax=Streptomyces triculaminicus TaxID=2816232 RepID=UPI0037D228CF